MLVLFLFYFLLIQLRIVPEDTVFVERQTPLDERYAATFGRCATRAYSAIRTGIEKEKI